MKVRGLWTNEPDACNKELLQEIAEQTVSFYSRERILATWPEGRYDLSTVNRVSGYPLIIERSITGLC
jgi:hypothetical protein